MTHPVHFLRPENYNYAWFYVLVFVWIQWVKPGRKAIYEIAKKRHMDYQIATNYHGTCHTCGTGCKSAEGLKRISKIDGNCATAVFRLLKSHVHLICTRNLNSFHVIVNKYFPKLCHVMAIFEVASNIIVCVYVCIYPNPALRARYDIRTISKCSKIVLVSAWFSNQG